MRSSLLALAAFAALGCGGQDQPGPEVRSSSSLGNSAVRRGRMDRQAVPGFDKMYRNMGPEFRKAIASKDDKAILAAITQELKNDPGNWGIRIEQAMLLERFGRLDEAKAALTTVLWPRDGKPVQEGVRRSVGRYLRLCELTQDKHGLQRALPIGMASVSSYKGDKPPKKLSSESEKLAAIAYVSGLRERGYDCSVRRDDFYKWACRLDPTVARYPLERAMALAERAISEGWVRGNVPIGTDSSTTLDQAGQALVAAKGAPVKAGYETRQIEATQALLNSLRRGLGRARTLQ